MATGSVTLPVWHCDIVTSDQIGDHSVRSDLELIGGGGCLEESGGFVNRNWKHRGSNQCCFIWNNTWVHKQFYVFGTWQMTCSNKKMLTLLKKVFKKCEFLKRVLLNLKQYKVQTVKYKVALCNTDGTWLPASSHKVFCGQLPNLDQVCNDVIFRVFYGKRSKTKGCSSAKA